jgi:hypothetical protein
MKRPRPKFRRGRVVRVKLLRDFYFRIVARVWDENTNSWVYRYSNTVGASSYPERDLRALTRTEAGPR